MKLLYPFANVMGLMFPVGKLVNGGSCEFATEKCLKKCCAHSPGAGTKIGFKPKREVFNYFLENPQGKIAEQILNELTEAGCKIFSWFASGDCPSFLTDKYFAIVKRLDIEGIIQTGFTRNEELWRRCKKLSSESRILLTVEDIEGVSSAGLYSIPDYKLGAVSICRVNIEKEKITSGGCGGGYYEDHIRKTGIDNSHLKLDCKACYKNKTGCFGAATARKGIK